MTLAGYSSVNSQDIVVKKDGSKIEVRIIEINDSSLVYMKWMDPDSIIYETPKALISQIVFPEHQINKKRIFLHNFEGAPKQNIKVGITSIMQHSFQLGYERMVSKNLALEGTFHLHSLIGFLENDLLDVDGWGMDIGAKYYVHRTSEDNMLPSYSPLDGIYLKGILYYTDRREINFQEISDYQAWVGGIQAGYVFSNKSGFNINFYGGIHFKDGKNNISPLDGRFTIPARLDISESNYYHSNNAVISVGMKMGYYF